jgi:glycolate oxidase FAD binding subunit
MARRAGSASVTMRPSTAAELASIVRDAHDRNTGLRVVARDTWTGRRASVAPLATALDVSALTGIIEYVPGDLTLTARAGTTIAEVEAATAAHGQWCPLMPWGGDDGTLGATFSTATHGPCSAQLGSPRDIAIGVEFVDGTGALVRAGGRVVKNVAGFDLTRLLVGSWGSLGVITEMSVRLRARPAVDESWSVAIAGDAARKRAEDFRRGPVAPLAMEEFEGRTLIRLGGNPAFVAAAREIVRGLGAAEPCDSGIWTRVRRADPKPRGPLATSAIGDPLSTRVKKQFDPRHILNPGIMGEELT